MIPDIKELNFLKKDGKQYATLTQATVTLADMGEKTITSQIKIDGEITPDFSTDWAVEFQGEKYIMPLRQPQGTKEHTSLNSTIDLTFQHWAIYQLKRWMFFTVHPVETGTAVADKYIADVILNLGDFCDLFGQVLRHYYGDTISIDLNPNWEYKAEPTYVSISHSYIWDVLIKFYELFAVRWQIEPMPSNNSEIKGGERYVIKVGYPTTEVDHIFKYGFEGGLLKVERQVQSADIRNMVLGRGGEKNLPLRYFKDVDPNNPDFRGDPDWIEELANIYFTNLHGATFRSYIQGWKAAHIAKYPGYTAIGESNAYASWAYHKGYTDTKFDPVEYVKDDASIAKYGPLLGGLDNNEEIYPTIQGSGMDIVVDVEQILSDDVAGSVTSDAVESSFADKDKPTITTESIDGYQRKIVEAKSGLFYVEAGKYANLDEGPKTFKVSQKGKKYGPFAIHERLEFGRVHTYTIEVSGFVVEAEDVSLVVVDAMTGEERSASGIPAGTYYFLIRLTLHNTSKDSIVVTVACESPKLTSATLDDNSWKNTFDIWVKNIWETSKLTSETDDQYAERVWKPILGDREKNNAKVLFTTGALAASEDYEFTIVGFPALDTSKSLNGELSHWRIKLAKSDADLESTGLYVPSTQRQGKAGDKFAFIGTEMTHDYTKWAEEALDNYKKDYLNEVKDIKPTWVVTTDRVKLNNEGNPNALIHVLKVGNTLRLADKRFIVNDESSESAYETLYLQSLTYTYRAASNGDSALNPDVEIVLSNEYATSANPVSAMQADISTLQQQIGSISNIEQIVRAIGDKLYLRKDGISDRSLSPTRFFSLLTSEDFRAGLIGGAGWGFFKDENGNWVLEADRVNVRQEMQANTLVINQAEGRGGMEIDTAAFMEVTRVDDTTDGYVCYFDQKDGSVANLFHVDDVAFCNRWTPENTELKFYKRRVTAVSIDNITLSKTDVNGSGIPAEKDNIIHFGNYTDKTRQYVKVRDVVGGGYERYLDGLDSVNAQGNEYYFVGKQNGLYDEKPRWFIGDKDGEYAEWVDGKLNIKGAISVQSTIGGDKIDEYIKKVSPPVEQEDIEDFVNNIVDPKIEGIQNQIDGVIETWFYNGVPTLTNYPANGWNTDALKVQHLGDLYYDNDTGTAYRFSQNSQGGYYWNTITDDAITKALAAAKEAQDTADSKRRIFTSQPAPPYDEGDLWVNATYPTDTTADTRNPESGKYYNDILRCGTSKASGAAFAISDWGLSSNYTDDTAANEALEKIAGYAYLKEALLDRSTTIGGVFLSSLIRLGQHNESLQTQTVWSGINGIYTKARDISYWAGGDALDLFNDDDTHKTLAQGARPAAAIIRMDGSAYFAKGNIGFRADGSGWLGNDKTGIKFSNTGVMTFGSGISVNVSNVSGLNKTLTILANFTTSLTALLCPCDANDNEISWEEATKSDNAGGIKAKSLKSKIGFWSDKFVSALGKNDNEGGGIIGATALSQLTDVSLSRLRNGDMLQFNGQKWTNVAMPSLRPDLTDYATQTWVNRNFIQAINTDSIYLSLVKGDGTKTRLIPPCAYGTRDTVLRRGSANVNFSNDGQLRHFFSSSSMTEGRPMGDGHIIHMEWDNSLSWASQLFLPNASSASMQWRTQPGSTWGAWRTLLDEANYAATLDGRYMSFAVEAGRDYVNASLSAAVGKKAHEGFIEFWDSAAGGWFNFKLGWLEAAGQVKAASFIRNGGTASQFLKADGSVDGTAYVNKAGDTLTGTLTAKRNQFLAYGAAGIDMNNSDITRLNGLWFADAYDSEGESINFYVDGSLWSRLGASGGTLYFNPSVGTSAHAFGHKVWHEGNDGDGSGLDADKLDGLHSTAFARCDKFQQVDLNTLNDFGFMENHTNADATPERHYPIQEAGLLIYGTAAYSSANQIYGSFSTNRWFARGGGWSTTNKTSWREFAFLDSNVASASKLATARTLWGQSFDGSGNVSGNMTGVGKITTTTLAIATTYDNTWSDGTNSHPWYGYDHRYHNTGVYSTTISDFYGLTLRTSQGNISMNATGNVGIGTTSPTQTLHVAGNVLVSGEAYYRTEGRAGSSWNNGYGALSVGIMNNNSQTPLLVAYRYGDLNWTIPHANRLFAMELLNSGSVLRFGFGGAAKFYFEKDGTFHSENGMWSEGYVSALGQNTSSDERLKRIIRPIKLTVDEIAKAPIYVFEWINGAGIEIGSIAQYWQSVLPEGVRTRTDSYLSMSGNFGLVAAICNARHIRDHEYLISDHGRRIELLERDKHKLEEDNRTLKEENLEIKRQLEQLTSVYNG